MEGGSEIEKNKTPECASESKSKRKMKTATQLEVLENTYAVTDVVLFCQRRLKDQKSSTPSKRKRQESAPTVVESSKQAPELVQLDSGTGIPIYADASKTASLCAHIRHPGDEFVKYDSMIHGASLTCISQDVLKILASVNKQASDSDRDIKEARMLVAKKTANNRKLKKSYLKLQLLSKATEAELEAARELAEQGRMQALAEVETLRKQLVEEKAALKRERKLAKKIGSRLSKIRGLFAELPKAKDKECYYLEIKSNLVMIEDLKKEDPPPFDSEVEQLSKWKAKLEADEVCEFGKIMAEAERYFDLFSG